MNTIFEKRTELKFLKGNISKLKISYEYLKCSDFKSYIPDPSKISKNNS